MTARARWTLAVAGLFLLNGFAAAQKYDPPPARQPDKETLQQIDERARKLRLFVRELKRHSANELLLADVEVYLKAAEWIVRHNEFYTADAGAATLAALDRGLLRASQMARGESPWLAERGRAVVRGYRSHIDDSVQPYAVTFPPGYGKEEKKWRLDVVLHGRDSSLTEVKFLKQHDGSRDAPKGQDFVVLEIYGRGNNAYRWAGEADIFEALDHLLATERLAGRPEPFDPARVVLRGFSMGGAGTWHIGLHHPDRYCVIAPGAGFTTTRGYAKLPPLPWYQEKCLSIYDAVDYAENAFDVPVVAYSGEMDPQMAAANNIEKRLRELKIDTMTHLIAPGLKHQFPPEWQGKVQAEIAKYAGKGRSPFPERVRFVTYTLKYPSCSWVELLGLERHYSKARVDATRLEGTFNVNTENVRALRLVLPPGGVFPGKITVDGQEVSTAIFTRALVPQATLEKRDGKWRAVLPQKIYGERLRRPQKMPQMQGPIDDAFTGAFVCVTGSGQPWHEGPVRHTDATLDRFNKEWNKYFRGELPVKGEEDVTDADIANKHLILFGDPSSNGLIAQVLDGLPVKWTKDELVVNGKKYDPAKHVPVLIFPNPLNPSRYVVINSGHTFHAPEFQGTNALLFPRLGDWAVLRPAPTDKEPAAFEVIDAGLFDDFWQYIKDEQK